MGKTSGIGLIACDLAGYQPGVVNLRPIVSQIVNRPACEVAKAACSGAISKAKPKQTIE